MQPSYPTPQPHQPHTLPGAPQPTYIQPVYVQAQKNSGLAIAAMVLGIIWIYWIGSILAVIFGHVALSQMKKNPQLGGRGMAIAGVVLGWIGVGILAIILLAAAGASGSSGGY